MSHGCIYSSISKGTAKQNKHCNRIARDRETEDIVQEETQAGMYKNPCPRIQSGSADVNAISID
jgi:hypothetical protein